MCIFLGLLYKAASNPPDSNVEVMEDNPGPNGNVLKFPWGTNFKHEGKLHTNVERFWTIVTLEIPRPEDFDLPITNFTEDCAWIDQAQANRQIANIGSMQQYIDDLKGMCRLVSPLIKLYHQKETYYNQTITRLLTEDLYLAFPQLRPNKRPTREIHEFKVKTPAQDAEAGKPNRSDSSNQFLRVADQEAEVEAGQDPNVKKLNCSDSSDQFLRVAAQEAEAEASQTSSLPTIQQAVALWKKNLYSTIEYESRPRTNRQIRDIGVANLNASNFHKEDHSNIEALRSQVLDLTVQLQKSLVRLGISETESIAIVLAEAEEIKFRQKRFAPLLGAIIAPLVGGLIRVGFEALSGHMHKKRQQAENKAREQKERNRLMAFNRHMTRLGQDNIMTGQFGIDSITDIMEIMQDLSKKQTLLEKLFTGQEHAWAHLFLDNIVGPTRFAMQLQNFLQITSEIHSSVYDPLIERLKDLHRSIARLAQGYLPPELFPVSKMQEILDTTAQAAAETHPHLELLIDSPLHLYDLKMVTFSIDPKAHTMVITFPVLFKQKEHVIPYALYSIETVPVPVLDLNRERNSYTTIEYEKPYIAVRGQKHITLTLAEMLYCKDIYQTKICEDIYTIRDKDSLSCAAAIFYGATDEIVKQKCKVKFEIDRKKLTPVILDGGEYIVMANMLHKKLIVCTDNEALPSPLEEEDYIKIKKSILCKCKIEVIRPDGSVDVEIPNTISSCNEKPTTKVALYTVNRAFYMYAKDLLSTAQQRSIPQGDTPNSTALQVYLKDKYPQDARTLTLEDMPVYQRLTKKVNTMQELVQCMETDYSRGTLALTAPEPEPEQTPILESTHYKAFSAFASVCVIILTIVVVIAIVKYCQQRSLVAAMTLANLPAVVSVYVSDPQTANGTIKYLLNTAAQTANQLQVQTQMVGICPSFPDVEVCYKSGMWLPITIVGVVAGLVGCFITIGKIFGYCRGYKHDNHCRLFLYLEDERYFVPLKLRRVHGNMTDWSMNKPLKAEQLTLVRNTVWDVLHIEWDDCIVYGENKPVHMPQNILIKLRDKIRIRRISQSPDQLVRLLATQNSSSMELTHVYRPKKRFTATALITERQPSRAPDSDESDNEAQACPV